MRPRLPRPAQLLPERPHNEVQVLGNLATIVPGAELGTVSHYDIQPVIDISTNVDGTDLGTVTRSMEKIIHEHEKDLPRGSHFVLRGQSETMKSPTLDFWLGWRFPSCWSTC